MGRHALRDAMSMCILTVQCRDGAGFKQAALRDRRISVPYQTETPLEGTCPFCMLLNSKLSTR
jgi:hypothetical protein